MADQNTEWYFDEVPERDETLLQRYEVPIQGMLKHSLPGRVLMFHREFTGKFGNTSGPSLGHICIQSQFGGCTF